MRRTRESQEKTNLKKGELRYGSGREPWPGAKLGACAQVSSATPDGGDLGAALGRACHER